MIFELNGDFWMILLILTMMTLVIVGLGNHASHFRLNGGGKPPTTKVFLGNSPWESSRLFRDFFSDDLNQRIRFLGFQPVRLASGYLT